MKPETLATIAQLPEILKRAEKYGYLDSLIRVDIPALCDALNDLANPQWLPLPNEQAWWWHWSGDDYCAPFIKYVMVSKTGPDRYFWANGEGPWCDEMSGFWMKVEYPNIPSRDEQARLLPSPPQEAKEQP